MRYAKNAKLIHRKKSFWAPNPCHSFQKMTFHISVYSTRSNSYAYNKMLLLEILGCRTEQHVMFWICITTSLGFTTCLNNHLETLAFSLHTETQLHCHSLCSQRMVSYTRLPNLWYSHHNQNKGRSTPQPHSWLICTPAGTPHVFLCSNLHHQTWRIHKVSNIPRWNREFKGLNQSRCY